MNIFKALGRLGKPQPKAIPETNSVEVKGNFNGKIYNGRQVLISSTGSLKGRIETKHLEICGNVEGNVAVENLLIRSSGQLHYYSLSYDDLFVEDGGILAKADN